MIRSSATIGSRLSRVVVLAVLVGILASVTFFLANDYRQAVAAERARLKGTTAAFAAAAAPSVQTGDERGVLLVLRGIRELPEVQHVSVRASDGNVLAEIGASAILEGRDGALDETGFVSMMTAKVLETAVDIRDGGQTIGSLTLTADITSLRTRYVDALKTSVLFAIILMLITAILARARIARIIQPLNVLAGEFGDIGRRSDLTRRLTNNRSDEIGVLIDAFNEMFGHIDERDRELKRHRDTLELTVEERTAELLVAKDDAERANAAKSDFLATVSHEIRTPMNGMMVMAEMLSAAPLSPKHLRYADVISRSGRGLLAIINDILDFSKIEAGMMTLEAIPFSLDAVLEDTASLFAERARDKNLTIVLNVAADVPLTFHGDPTRVGQVVGNLVNNALKFTETGGVAIEAFMRSAQPNEAAHVEVHVRDTGIGIAPDKIGTIFQRFSQADQTITRRFGGTGLGLSISRKLVEAMGGELRVSSEPGRGSDFFFRIAVPFAEAADQATRLDGKSVRIVAEDKLIKGSVEAAMVALGARLDENEAPDVALVLAGSPLGIQLRGTPVVVLKPFAAVGGSTGDVADPVGELSLPLTRGELEAFAQAAVSGDWRRLGERSKARSSVDPLPDFHRMRVLAVDDSPVNREVLAEALSGFSITPTLAESGVDAVELATRWPFDVIFMDCSMPGMDGFAATAAIREAEVAADRTPAFIVALTAHVTGEEASRWSRAGMNAYVAKPFTIAQLATVLGNVERSEMAAQTPTHTEAAKPGTVPDIDLAPLLAPDTLAMFASLSASTGNALSTRVFGLFRNHAPRAFDDLKASIATRSDGAAALAHALKSMCLSAGAGRAAAACAVIEGRLKAGNEVTPEALDELGDILRTTDAAMDSYLGASELPALDQASSTKR